MQVTIKANTLIYFAVLLLIVPVRWIIAWIIAIVFHELCHLITVKMCRGYVYRLKIGLGGADMQCSNMTDECSFIAILSGPIGGFVLTGFGRLFPRIALCSFALSVYNLLPLLPFDGGRALHILIKNKRILCCMEHITLIILVLAGVFVSFILRLGVFPLAVVFGIWLKNRNIPCKEENCRVQ